MIDNRKKKSAMILSANKANRLYWLGRYAERGYLMLHLMRRAYDEVLDAPCGVEPYSEFLKKLDVYVANDMAVTDQIMSQIYEPETVTSLRRVIEMMMDNAIVLRAEIHSESFSYIELCRTLIRGKAELEEKNITELQPITDWLLAFWGSIRERVHGETYELLEIGRLVEHLDMNVRFDYKFYRLAESWDVLSKYIGLRPSTFDRIQSARLAILMADETAYDAHDVDNKARILSALNQLVLV